MAREASITLNALKGLLQRNPALSAAMLAGVYGLPQPTLAAALRNPQVYLGSQRESDLLQLAHDCVRVLDSLLPLRIAPGDAATLRLLIRSQREPEEIHTTVLSLLEPK